MNCFFTKKNSKIHQKGFITLTSLIFITLATLIAPTKNLLASLVNYETLLNSTSKIASDESYYVQPVIFFPTDYPTDQAVVNHVTKMLNEIQAWYKLKMNGKTFNLKTVKTITGDNDSKWYWCYENEVGCHPKDITSNVKEELNRKGIGLLNQNEKNVIYAVVLMGGGGYAGGISYVDSGGAMGMIGDISIYPELDKNCNRVKELYFKGDTVNSKKRCIEENMTNTKQGTGSFAHELGHAFDLPHPDKYGYGAGSKEWESSLMGNFGVFPNIGLLPEEISTLSNSTFFQEQTVQPNEPDNNDTNPETPEPINAKKPSLQSGTISGTVNVAGSPASKVTVSVNGNTYNASSDSGIAWKYKTADLPAGSYPVTATATLTNNNGTISGTVTANSGATNADITISAYSGSIIEEKCGAKGVSDTSLGGFLYTACMSSTPTTLAQAEQGKFDQNKAALAKDNGNPYCGKSAYDVYECKDGSIETVTVGESEDTCNKFPWCPEAGKTGLQPDPCAGPDKGEACSCQPYPGSSSNKGNCKDPFLCSLNNNGTGHACCPTGKFLCLSKNTCIGTSEQCGPGVATASPIPTQFQNLGCPNQNSDGTQNVCSKETVNQPTDGLRGGKPGYDKNKMYERLKNGDAACSDYYKSSNSELKYCWKESLNMIPPATNP